MFKAIDYTNAVFKFPSPHLNLSNIERDPSDEMLELLWYVAHFYT